MHVDLRVKTRMSCSGAVVGDLSALTLDVDFLQKTMD
jgi:hypothetical protein